MGEVNSGVISTKRQFHHHHHQVVGWLKSVELVLWIVFSWKKESTANRVV